MSRGRVSWFSDSLGYGFIETPTGDRVLVRPAALEGLDESTPESLHEGQQVKFIVRSRDDGVIEARSVTPLE